MNHTSNVELEDETYANLLKSIVDNLDYEYSECEIMLILNECYVVYGNNLDRNTIKLYVSDEIKYNYDNLRYDYNITIEKHVNPYTPSMTLEFILDNKKVYKDIEIPLKGSKGYVFD